jgi:hypothetical protein
MSNYIDLAKAYSRKGYSVIPTTSEKVPAIRNWGIWQTRPMTEEECEQHFKDCYGIALLMGGVKRLTAIEFDLKYDLSADLFDRFKSTLPNELLKRMYVQTTKNRGFHFVFSSPVVEPNQKLASRHTTADEKHQTYMHAFQDPKNKDKALKMALNDKMRVLIETRGGSNAICGGYVLVAPTPGYEHIHGKIQEISESDYHLILEAARSFNQVKEEKIDIRLDKYKEWELSPFADYNQRGDVLSVLFDSGWEECNNGYGKSVRLRRAGAVTSASSALFDPERRLFNCFSTSTSFDVNRSYSPTDIFIELECEGDLSVAFKKLITQGFGLEKPEM